MRILSVSGDSATQYIRSPRKLDDTTHFRRRLHRFSPFSSLPENTGNSQGTYAGLSREAVGKYVKLLEKEGLIQKVRTVDTTTHLQSKGTYLRILSSLEFAKTHPEINEEETKPESAVDTARSRVSRYPDIRIPRQ